jgi:hypothetical protein
VHEYSVNRLDDEGLADAINVETLPRLLEAEGLNKEVAAALARRETFETFRVTRRPV